jgi:hypothetical protein
MSIEREEKLIRAFLEKGDTVLYGHFHNLDARVARVKADLEAANLEVYALRGAKPGERYLSNNTDFDVWSESRDCYGPRLIVRKRRVPTATGRLTVSAPAVQEIPRKKAVTPTPFEKRFYNESTITYETAPDQGFQAFFLREEREVVITHTTEKAVKTYSAKAHPDDQYDEQFGFELAAARLWEIPSGSEAIQDFIYFRAYVWGVKGWGVLDLTQFHERWPRVVSDLLAASKDASFRQRVVGAKPKTETPFEIITRYKETTERGKEDRKTALQLWKDLKDAGYTPVDVRDAKTGDKFWWSCWCEKVLPFPENIAYWGDDPVLILAKTEAETPATPKPEPTQEDLWIEQESEDWHEGETATERAARVRAFLKEKGLKVVDYRVSTYKDFHIRQDDASDPIQNIAGGNTFGGKRLIVEPVTPVPSPADEKALNFIRQELREEGRDVTLAEGFLKQYREWGFEPVDYRPAKEGEWVSSVFSGTVDKPTKIGYNSRSKLQIFRKRS